jgi:hypothetical protein
MYIILTIYTNNSPIILSLLILTVECTNKQINASLLSKDIFILYILIGPSLNVLRAEYLF